MDSIISHYVFCLPKLKRAKGMVKFPPRPFSCAISTYFLTEEVMDREDMDLVEDAVREDVVREGERANSPLNIFSVNYLLMLFLSVIRLAGNFVQFSGFNG